MDKIRFYDDRALSDSDIIQHFLRCFKLEVLWGNWAIEREISTNWLRLERNFVRLAKGIAETMPDDSDRLAQTNNALLTTVATNHSTTLQITAS